MHLDYEKLHGYNASTLGQIVAPLLYGYTEDGVEMTMAQARRMWRKHGLAV